MNDQSIKAEAQKLRDLVSQYVSIRLSGVTSGFKVVLLRLNLNGTNVDQPKRTALLVSTRG